IFLPSNLIVPNQDGLAQHQDIHPGSQEAVERLLWLAHHRLVLVERGIKHHRHAGEITKRSDQAVIPRIGALAYRLQPSGTVDMSDRWDQRPLLRTDLEYLHHEGHGAVLLEPVRHRILKHRWREGPKRFAPLDLAIEHALHVAPAGIAYDRPVSERAR